MKWSAIIVIILSLSISGMGHAAEEAAAAGAPGKSTAKTADAGEKGLGMTQGEFALVMIVEAQAERLLEGAATGRHAAEKLAEIGLTPEGGWNIDKPLMRGDLEFAYKRLMRRKAVAERAVDEARAASTDQKDAAKQRPEPALDVTRLSIPVLIDAIVQAVREAFADVASERQPVSPTGANWDF